MSKLLNVYTALMNAYHMFQHAAALSIAIDPSKQAVKPSTRVLYFVENFNHFESRMEDSEPFIKYILKLITIANQRGFRRYRDAVYEEHFTEDGYATSYWKQACTMQQFIYEESSRERSFEMFTLANKKGFIKTAEDYLNTFHDSEFPFIRIDRHVFAFRNGIYFAATKKFRAYKDGRMNWGADTVVNARQDIVRTPTSTYYGLSGGLRTTNAAANFFDEEFVDYEQQGISWWDIPTPTLSKIFNDQEIPEAAQRVAFGLLGRLLYETGEMDDWQVVLWILGRANSGKST